MKPKRAFLDAYAPDKLAKAFQLTAYEAHLLSVLFRWVDFELPHAWTGSKTELAERGMRSTRRAVTTALAGLQELGLIHYEEHRNQSVTVRLLCWEAINMKTVNENAKALAEWLDVGEELPVRRRANKRDAVETGSEGSPTFKSVAGPSSVTATSAPSSFVPSALVPIGANEQVETGNVASISATTARRARDEGATCARRVASISATDDLDELERLGEAPF